MAESAAVTGRPRTLDAAPDGVQDRAQARERTYPTDDELKDRIVSYIELEEAKRPYTNRVNSLRTMMRDLIKVVQTQRPDAEGWWVITEPQMRDRLYDSREKRQRSPRRWLGELERMGFIERDVATIGTGKLIGSRFRLRPQSAWWSVPSEPRRSSSAGQAARFERRRETRKQRRRRCAERHRPRAGRDSRAYLIVRRRPGQQPGPVSSASSRFGPSGALPHPTTSGRESREQTRGHATLRAPGGPPAEPSPDELLGPPWWASAAGGRAWPPPPVMGGVSDALHSACPPSDRAALDGLRCLGIEQGIGAVVDAGRAGAPIAAVLLALWALACPGREPRLSVAMAAQLQRSSAQLDRLHGPGAAAAGLGELFAGVRNGVDMLGGDELRSAAWAVLALKGHARAARRRHRGAPPPRRWRPRGAP